MEYEFDVEMENLEDGDELLDYDDSDIAVPVPGSSTAFQPQSLNPICQEGSLDKALGLDEQESVGIGLNVVPPLLPDNQIPNPVREADMDSGYSATPPTPAPNNIQIPNHSAQPGIGGETSTNSENVAFEAQEEDLDELCLDIEDPDIITIDTSTARKQDDPVPRRGSVSLTASNDPDKIIYIAPISVKGLKSTTETDAKTRIRYYLNPFIASTLEPEKLSLRLGGTSGSESEIGLEANSNYMEGTSEVIYQKPADDILCDLYQSLNLYENPAQTPTLLNVSKQFRLNGVLIRGTRQMSSNDIFQYLRNHEQLPVKMEWINDSQCIVIFNDQYEAGRALLDMSKPIGEPSDENPAAKPGDLKLNYEYCDIVPSNAVEVAMPLSHTWRYAVPCDHAKGILMTIPRKSDKKQEYAERASEFYRKHGNPNKEEQGIFTPKGYYKRFSQKEEPHRPSKVGRFDKSRLGVKGETNKPVGIEESDDGSKVSGTSGSRYQELQNHKRPHMVAFEKPKERTIILPDDDVDDDVVEIPKKLKYGGMVADIEEKLLQTRGPRILKVPGSTNFNPHAYDPFLDEGKDPASTQSSDPFQGRISRIPETSSSQRRGSIKERLGFARRHN